MQTIKGYELSTTAILALGRAATQRQSAVAFDAFAPHVPAKDRGKVWMAIPLLLDNQHPQDNRDNALTCQ